MSDHNGAFVLAVDQGTSATTASLFTLDGQAMASADVEVRSTFPKPGWVEQDPFELLDSIHLAIRKVILQADLQLSQIVSLGLANQGESFLIWDLETGEPVHPVISWQCVRSADFCHGLIASGHEPDFRGRTGLPIDPEWPATKIPWLLENVEGLANRALEGRIVYGQLDTWFIFNLTGKQHHLTDHSTASRSGLYNIHSRDWDPSLVKLFEAEQIAFPRIVDSAADFGVADLGNGWKIPLKGSALDQSAALLGQGCVVPGELKVTYGTCSALWYNNGPTPRNTNDLSTSVAWQVDSHSTYAIVGEAGTAGAVVAWLRDKMRIPWSDEELSAVAESAEGQNNLIFVNAFSGLGAPHWAPEAQGTIYGLTAGTSLEHLVRAGLEAVAFSVRDLVDALARDDGLPLPDVIKVDGGMAANDYLMQFQADILGKTIVVPENLEGTSKGVAFLAGLGAGKYSEMNAIRETWRPKRVYEPRMSQTERDARYGRWQEAVAHTIAIYAALK